IKGDNNNLYRPTASLSRAEAATILTRLVEGENIVTADTNVSSSTTLSNKIYVNDLTINKALASNDLNIDSCLILGTLYVEGGGQNTVTLTDTLARNMIVAKTTGDVRVLLTGYSTVEKASLTYGAILEQKSLQGDGYKVVNLDGSSLSTQEVGLVGSFDQVNVNTGSIIKSTSGTISNLDITRSSSGDTVQLSGTYTTVNVAPKINLDLLSGKISTLNMGTSSDNSTVKMSSGTTITTAIVDGSTAFTGTGKISTMKANVNDITYETKPTTITKGSGVTRPPVLSADVTAPQPTFTPADGATNIIPNTTIKIVFDEAIYKSNGNAVATADIQNIVQIRENTSTGTERAYTAIISSDKKTITITPTDVLLNSKDYYIIILSGTIEDSLGNTNSKITSQFKTGTQDVAAPTVTFSPVSGASNVSINSTIVLTFNESVYKYNGGAALASSDFDLSDTKDIILLRTTNSSGADVSYSASVTSSSKVITITPHSSLASNATYYLAVNTNKLKDSTGNVVPLTNSNFSTVAINSNKTISSFSFVSPSVAGVVNETTHTIAITVPFGTSLSSLTPTIAHNGGSISPSSGVAQNFTSPVTYIVTATDATTQAYVITVTVTPISSAKAITSFGFNSPSVAAVVNESAHSIAVTVPYGTNITALVANFANSPLSNVKVGAVTQTSGVTANDFTSSVSYLVTAQDATTATYVVTVTIAAAPKAITSFSFATPYSIGSINESAGTIALMVPYGTDITNLTPTIVQTGTTISPLTGASNNFTSPVTYTVTALDSSTKAYIVTVSVIPASTDSTVTSSVYTVTNSDPLAGTITNVPANTNSADFISNLHKGQSNQSWVVSGNPASVMTGDTLQVTAQDGSVRTYTITVN
ncbi:MAG: Ig-like domain-containing protein, partial [Eubacteriales bacterium]